MRRIGIPTLVIITHSLYFSHPFVRVYYGSISSSEYWIHRYLFLLYCYFCDSGGLLSCHQCTARTDLYRGQGFSICLSPSTVPHWIKDLSYSKNVENLVPWNNFLVLIPLTLLNLSINMVLVKLICLGIKIS